jgi:hypothetical protein
MFRPQHNIYYQYVCLKIISRTIKSTLVSKWTLEVSGTACDVTRKEIVAIDSCISRNRKTFDLLPEDYIPDLEPRRRVIWHEATTEYGSSTCSHTWPCNYIVRRERDLLWSDHANQVSKQWQCNICKKTCSRSADVDVAFQIPEITNLVSDIKGGT